MSQTKHYDAETTARALNFPALIAALQRMFVAGCVVPQRHSHILNEETSVLIMPAWQPDGYFGIKTVTICATNAARGLPGLFSTYQLFDAQTGVALATMDGNEITSRRTAAASALAASHLADANAHTLLVLGAGRVGSLLPEAYRAVLPITRVLVWDIHKDAAHSLEAKLQAQGIDAEAVDELSAACKQADVVSCATLATAPLIQGDWLRPHSHLDLIGSFRPEMREADDDCFRSAEIWVDTDEALIKSGDLIHPMERGVFKKADVRGTLSDLCTRPPGPVISARRTVFKAVGTALEDLAAAILVLEGLE